MSNVQRRLRDIVGVAVFAGFLAGCGGSSGAASAPASNPPAPITGIATPSSVSVVTATNAN